MICVLCLDDLPLLPQRDAAELPQGAREIDCMTGGKEGKLYLPLPKPAFNKMEKDVIGYAEEFISKNGGSERYVAPFPGLQGLPKEWPANALVSARKYIRDVIYIGNGLFMFLTYGTFNDWAAPLFRESDGMLSYSTDLDYFNLAYGLMNVDGCRFNDQLYGDVVDLSKQLCVKVYRFDSVNHVLLVRYRVTRQVVDEMYRRCVKYEEWALCALRVMAHMTYGMVAEEYFVRRDGTPTKMGRSMKLRGFKTIHDNPGNPGIVVVASDCDRQDSWERLAVDTLLRFPELVTERCVTWDDRIFAMAEARLRGDGSDRVMALLRQGVADRDTVVTRAGFLLPNK